MDGDFERGWREVISGESRQPWAPAARAGLSALSALYGGSVAAYRAAVAMGLVRVETLPCPTVSIGNLTVGGTGKTTTVRWLARRLHSSGMRPAILSYGYRLGATKVEKNRATIVSDGETVLEPASVSGDEPQMLARSLPGVPVVIGRRRVKTGRVAWERFQPDVVLLDDAFQYWRLAKDLEIVLIDAENPFGYGHLLPRGLLREPVTALKRAHAAIVTHADRIDPDGRAAVAEELRRINPALALAQARHRSVGWRDDAGVAVTVDEVREGRWLAVSSLGLPESFERSLTDLGVAFEAARFPDHHPYTRQEVAEVCARVKREGLAGVVTTEKDSVKMGRDWTEGTAVRVLEIDLECLSGQNELDTLLHSRIRRTSRFD